MEYLFHKHATCTHQGDPDNNLFNRRLYGPSLKTIGTGGGGGGGGGGPFTSEGDPTVTCDLLDGVGGGKSRPPFSGSAIKC